MQSGWCFAGIQSSCKRRKNCQRKGQELPAEACRTFLALVRPGGSFQEVAWQEKCWQPLCSSWLPQTALTPCSSVLSLSWPAASSSKACHQHWKLPSLCIELPLSLVPKPSPALDPKQSTLLHLPAPPSPRHLLCPTTASLAPPPLAACFQRAWPTPLLLPCFWADAAAGRRPAAGCSRVCTSRPCSDDTPM